MASIFVTGAQAVHDTGVFQLDGDASSSTLGTPPATDDWDKVCHEATGSANCGTTSNTSGATAVAWTGDGATACVTPGTPVGCGFGGNLNSTIFTGGGSKDPQDISNWAWKDGAGGLPDKDNIVHAFAARYSLPDDPVGGATACPAGSFPTCEVIYFGLDRFDNSGDAQNAFWFLQAGVSLGTKKVGGALGFTGLHTNGDLLVISDFSNGGTTATITVDKWDTSCTATNKPDPDCADANLRQLETSTNALCASSLAAGDPFCGIVNPTNGTAVPWSGDYTDKSGNHTYLNGEFYEAGINLSTLGLAGECFSSVVSETRSSTSTTATLKDFVIGHFAQCKPNLTTQASAEVATPVLPGVAVHDTATIAVTGGANPPDPTGTVTFSYCFNATSVPSCPASGNTAAGTGLLGDENHDGTIDDTTPNDGLAKALSNNVNTVASPLAPGFYCFRASWPGDTNYPGALNVTNQTSECFRVKDTSSVATHQIWLPNDKATVTSAGGTALNGTVKFVLYAGSTCSGTQLWPTATDPAGTGEFTLTNGVSGATVGPTTNTAVTVEADATVSWKVTFTSTDGGVDSPASPTCEISTLNLTPDQP